MHAKGSCQTEKVLRLSIVTIYIPNHRAHAMTNPDAASAHDVSPTFTWSNKYDEQLRYIADTDELPDGEETFDWPQLRDAIKHKIRLAVDAFDQVPSPLLHPAARALGMDARISASSSSSSSSNSGANGSGLGITNVPSSAAAAAQGLEDRFASKPNGGASTSNGEGEEDVSMSFEDDENEESDSSDDKAKQQNPNNTSTSISTDIEPPTDSESSGFYPAKTKAPSERKGNWGRVLSKSETQSEINLIFEMLDDFEESPPFTIQRLSELVLDPKTYVRSGPKLLSSLMRLLSVTASHADFPPVSPGQPPVSTVNTAANGGVSTRSVGPPSPSSEPLFSPIPFLTRRQAANEDSSEEDHNVPALDLNGSGEQEQQQTPVAPIPSIPLPEVSSAGNATTGSLGSNANSQPLGIPPGQVDELEGSTTAAAASTASSSAQHHMDGAVHPLTSTTTSTTTPDKTMSESPADDDDRESATSHKRMRSQSPAREESSGAQSGIERAGEEAKALDEQKKEA